MTEKAKVIVSIRKPCVDARGEINNIVDAPFTSAAVITSNKGAIRGNHYHKTDYHYCYLASGEMVYFHRQVGSKVKPKRWLIKAGQLFYTPPRHEHAMHFTKKSVMYVFARNNREMANYEADTIRIAPIGY